ncbi:hypothetical protein RCS94_06780 [Orbaceae bacterium ac157xtp]
MEKDRKKIQIDRKDQNDPKRIHARGALPTTPRRQGRRTEFGAFVFCSLCDKVMFSFLAISLLQKSKK